jgi:hypothetical protein
VVSRRQFGAKPPHRRKSEEFGEEKKRLSESSLEKFIFTVFVFGNVCVDEVVGCTLGEKFT